MKKFLLIIGLMVFVILSYAQTPYKYVIIPTQFAEFTKGFNPYGLSTSLQKEFNEKSISNTFESSEIPDDYCDALTVNLTKLSNMFRNKLKVELRDCRNRVVWSREGMGNSKQYKEGYAEAIAEALKDLDKLPINPEPSTQAYIPISSKPTGNEDKALLAETINQQSKVAENRQPGKIEVRSTGGSVYKPGNLFYNYTYFVDVVDTETGKKELVLINGKLLGYQDLQKIGMLTPSGLDQVYTLEWITAEGNTVRGVANLSGNELKISLPKEEELEVIQLQKYE